VLKKRIGFSSEENVFIAQGNTSANLKVKLVLNWNRKHNE